MLGHSDIIKQVKCIGWIIDWETFSEGVLQIKFGLSVAWVMIMTREQKGRFERMWKENQGDCFKWEKLDDWLGLENEEKRENKKN